MLGWDECILGDIFKLVFAAIIFGSYLSSTHVDAQQKYHGIDTIVSGLWWAIEIAFFEIKSIRPMDYMS